MSTSSLDQLELQLEELEAMLTPHAAEQKFSAPWRRKPGSQLTRRWRKGDSNSRSHPDGELSQRIVLVDICDGDTDGAPATTADRGTQVRTRLAAGGGWIRTSSSWSRACQEGDGTQVSKTRADLERNRRFESISLQRRVCLVRPAMIRLVSVGDRARRAPTVRAAS
jgi:hypothetical protein